MWNMFYVFDFLIKFHITKANISDRPVSTFWFAYFWHIKLIKEKNELLKSLLKSLFWFIFCSSMTQIYLVLHWNHFSFLSYMNMEGTSKFHLKKAYYIKPKSGPTFFSPRITFHNMSTNWFNYFYTAWFLLHT